MKLTTAVKYLSPEAEAVINEAADAAAQSPEGLVTIDSLFSVAARHLGLDVRWPQQPVAEAPAPVTVLPELSTTFPDTDDDDDEPTEDDTFIG